MEATASSGTGVLAAGSTFCCSVRWALCQKEAAVRCRSIVRSLRRLHNSKEALRVVPQQANLQVGPVAIPNQKSQISIPFNFIIRGGAASFYRTSTSMVAEGGVPVKLELHSEF